MYGVAVNVNRVHSYENGKISKQPLNQQQDIKTGEQLILMKYKASSGGNAVKWNHKWVPINHPYHLP